MAKSNFIFGTGSSDVIPLDFNERRFMELAPCQVARRGYLERNRRKVRYDHGEEALKQAQIRSKIEDHRIQAQAERECREVWDDL